MGSNGMKLNRLLLLNGCSDPLFVEHFRALRAKFEHRLDSLKIKVVAVSSAIAGEGKSMLSANLAIGLAATGRKRVLLVDADVRKADLGLLLNAAHSPGLSEFLDGTSELASIVHNCGVSGLKIVPAGRPRVAASADLLSGNAFRSFLSDMRHQFDVILLDTPPILPVADALTICEMIDGYLLVFRANFTPYHMFRQAVEHIGDKNVLGVVMNGVATRAQRSYYRRYYGRYYSQPDNT